MTNTIEEMYQINGIVIALVNEFYVYESAKLLMPIENMSRLQGFTCLNQWIDLVTYNMKGLEIWKPEFDEEAVEKIARQVCEHYDEERAELFPSHIRYIVIDGREWFDKKNGNSYHSVCVTVKFEEQKISFCLPFCYGRGDHYLQTAIEAINERVGCELGYHYQNLMDLDVTYSIASVAKRKDLHCGGRS